MSDCLLLWFARFSPTVALPGFRLLLCALTYGVEWAMGSHELADRILLTGILFPRTVLSPVELSLWGRIAKGRHSNLVATAVCCLLLLLILPSQEIRQGYGHL